MHAVAVRPTGVERSFGEEEIIVTKTDGRGIITYANEVFLRVSAFEEHQVIGRPHKLVRHPDMPRAVFDLMWDRIAAGFEVFAYVVNLAADGAHYWVLAHVTPTLDARGRLVAYHSNRRTADRGALDRIRPLYAALSAAERRHDHVPDAVRAGRAALDEVLAHRRQSYDEFVWSLAEPMGASC